MTQVTVSPDLLVENPPLVCIKPSNRIFINRTSDLQKVHRMYMYVRMWYTHITYVGNTGSVIDGGLSRSPGTMFIYI